MKETLYHGSDTIVKKPMYGVGKSDNDYGSGFYTTKIIEKAREWALVNGANGAFCNIYEIEMAGLSVLNLDEYGVLAWVAEVVSHRGANSSITEEVSARLIEKYKLDTSSADIIIGYRADDSYMTVIEAFLKNELTVDEVDRLFRKGDLGQQVFIKSPKAFDSPVFVGYEEVKPNFGTAVGNADAKARREVFDFLNHREKAIQIDGFVPSGITVRDAISNYFKYNKEYSYYEMVNDLAPESSQIFNKKGEDYEIGL